MESNKGIILLLVATILIISSFAVFVRALPLGATVTDGAQETKPATPTGTDTNAGAGNITEVNITGESVTQSWQGYYGEVSGTITLDNANNYTLYNWTIIEVQGEVYAANESIDWTEIQCFNFTANGSLSDGLPTAGATNLGGMNISMLEDSYGINITDVDGVNETFNFTGSSQGHDLFYTGAFQFAAGECQSTRLFGNAHPIINEFEEVLLYDANGNMPVFASILENNVAGFDTTTTDFEMIVLEDGHNGDTAGSTYYFYLELG